MDKYNNILIQFKNLSDNIIDNNSNMDDENYFNNYLDSKVFTNNYNKNSNIKNITFSPLSFELIIRPECNQKCDYCYITQYGDKLYPVNERINNEQILINLQKIFNFVKNKQSFIKKWEIFAGDLFYDDLWFDVMDIFYDYYVNLFKEYPVLLEYLQTNNTVIKIANPNNCSFCHNKEQINKVQEYIDKFAKINIRIYFSYSHDGPYSMDLREKQELSEEYYDEVFNFLNNNNFGSHPMISAEGIDNAIQNYEWWKNQQKKYYIHNKNYYNGYLPMFLEVRNDGWTEEKIQKYLKLLDYMLEDRLKMCNNDILNLTYNLFNKSSSHHYKIKDFLPPLHCNDLIRLRTINKQNARHECVLGHAICIKLNNLTIVPCHRMAYPQFEAGVLTDNSRFKIKNNIHAYFNMKEISPLNLPGCSVCEYRFFCMKGCIGSQYESNGDYLIPVRSVCKLLKAKIDFLFKKYHELGLFHCYFQNEQLFNSKKSISSTRYLEFLLMKGYKEYEQYL